jgi:iron-sulfur cluster assembly protein
MTETDAPVVALTEGAVRQIRRMMARKGAEGSAVRLGVKGGGCSGMSYVIRFDETPRATDRVWEIDGLRVAVDPKSAGFLTGATLDYSVRNLMDGGWVWDNPNAGRSCGCGTSFAPKT